MLSLSPALKYIVYLVSSGTVHKNVSFLRSNSVPAFSGSFASAGNLMPAPFEPPVLLAASYVPLLCHASLIYRQTELLT